MEVSLLLDPSLKYRLGDMPAGCEVIFGKKKYKIAERMAVLLDRNGEVLYVDWNAYTEKTFAFADECWADRHSN